MATYAPTRNNGAEKLEEGRSSDATATNGAHGYKSSNMDEGDDTLARLRSAQSVSISPELFEKLYLSPPNRVKGQLRKTFGNPTPIALVGFLLSLSPLSCDLMGWRGAGGNGAATTGVYFFHGGLLMVLGGFLEWVLGNTFASVVFLTFGGFWLSFGGTLVPSFNAYGAYATPGEAASTGLTTQGFNASLGFWLLFMGLICFIFLVCSVRTNIVFMGIFLTLVLVFTLLTGTYWALAADAVGNAAIASRCRIGAGACAFVTSMFGWYLFTSIMLAVVDFPMQLPVGDLTTVVKGRSERVAARGN